jgi:uncharacterized protein with HEPN domain
MSKRRKGRVLDDGVRIQHMRDATRRALEIASGKSVANLDPDSETALALVRLLEVLGEAARHMSLGTQAKYPAIPWRDIGDTRNRIIHEYFDVDFEIIAAIIRDDLPPLQQQLDAIIAEMDA